jgi:RNA polymerase sigma-B factor
LVARRSTCTFGPCTSLWTCWTGGAAGPTSASGAAATRARAPSSLEEPRFPDAPETEPPDGPAVAEAGYERVEDRVFLDTLMRSLSKRSRAILRLRFDEDLVQREIAERIGYSQIHVSRIVREALETMQALAEPHAA